MNTQPLPLETLTLRGFPVGPGRRPETVRLRYRTYGRPDLGGENGVLLFTYYTGTDLSYAPWIGSGRAVDPDRHFVVVVNHFGGGVSSSPSQGEPLEGLTLADTVHAAGLLLDHLGVETLRLTAGWSLGGMQALELAAQVPWRVSAVLAVCSAARCSEINRVFLDSVTAALRADSRAADPDAQASPQSGLDAFGRVYAGWAYSESFFAEHLYREFGHATAEAVLEQWGRDHREMDAGDLMASLRMWREADLGAGRGGLPEALRSIRARTILMPSTTDGYFTVRENRTEAAHLPNGELRPLDSPLGHIAGRPGIRAREQRRVDQALRELLT